jgi:hypothetical protein
LIDEEEATGEQQRLNASGEGVEQSSEGTCCNVVVLCWTPMLAWLVSITEWYALTVWFAANLVACGIPCADIGSDYGQVLPAFFAMLDKTSQG